METPKEKVIQLINKELEENYELINDEKNYYHDDIQAVKIQTNFLAKMLSEVEEIPDPTAKLKSDKEELLEMLKELKWLKFIKHSLGKNPYYLENQPKAWEKVDILIQKHKQ